MEITRAARSPPDKGPAEYFTGTVRVDPLFRASDPARVGGAHRHVRARRAHGVAHSSARPDADRHVRLRLGAARGRPDRGNPARRRDLVPARRETLARRDGDDGDDAHRHPGGARRKDVDWLEKVSDEQYAGKAAVTPDVVAHEAGRASS